MPNKFISDEEKALFEEHMRSVTPLKEKKPRVQTEKPKVTLPMRKRRETVEEPTTTHYYLSDLIQDPVLSQSTLSYSQSGVTMQRVKALRKGEIPWEGRLDLHGLQADKARDALCHFIMQQSEQGKRCLLIIHGKGGKEGAPPVIKNLVNRWLPQFAEVLAFHSALPQHGGNGAVYVLLKKQR